MNTNSDRKLGAPVEHPFICKTLKAEAHGALEGFARTAGHFERCDLQVQSVIRCIEVYFDG